MDGRIHEQPLTFLCGLSFYGNPFAQSAGWTEDNEIGRLWARLVDLRDHALALPPPIRKDEMYEIHIPDGGTAQTGRYEVFVGYPVAQVESVPLSLCVKVVPAGLFARFTLLGSAITDEDSYSGMYDWITDQRLSPAADWMYNLYDSRFRGMEHIQESALDVCIPVVLPDAEQQR